MKSTLTRVCLSALAALALSLSSAKAEQLTYLTEGTLSSSVTLNGTALGVDTAFGYTFTFDPLTDYAGTNGPIALYHLHDLSFTLGETTYSVSTDNTYFNAANISGKYYVGLQVSISGVDDPSEGTIMEAFQVANPSFDAFIITPSLLSDPASTAGSHLILSLAGLGDLAIAAGDVTPTEASITAVPEPSCWVLLGLGVPALLGVMRLRGRRA